MSVRFLSLLAAVGLLAAGPAAAHHGTQSGRTAIAVKIAERTWGPPPCGEVHVFWRSLRDSTAAARPEDCSIYLNTEDRWLRREWYPFCRVLVHEVGHLAGQSHSEDPRDAMFPGWGRGRLDQCRPSSW